MNPCNNLCESDHYSKCRTAGLRTYACCKYSDGWKRCITCARSFLTDAKRCPCCAYNLRAGPRARG